MTDLPHRRDDGWSGRRTAEIVGISYRQLDYWARTSLIRPSISDASGSGSRRSYSYEDLLQLRLVKVLTDSGVRLERIRHAMPLLRRHRLDQGGSIVIVGGLAGVLTDDALAEMIAQRGLVHHVLACSTIVDHVEAAIVADAERYAHIHQTTPHREAIPPWLT